MSSDSLDDRPRPGCASLRQARRPGARGRGRAGGRRLAGVSAELRRAGSPEHARRRPALQPDDARWTWPACCRSAPTRRPRRDLPDPFANLNYEQYIGIRALPSAICGTGKAAASPSSRCTGASPSRAPVSLFIVEDGAVRRVIYDRTAFDYGKLQLPATLPDLGFSGFRVFGDAQSGRPARGRDLPGRQLLPLLGPGPEPRRHGARPDPEGRRSQGRGVPPLSGLLDRAARRQDRQPRHPRPARFRERRPAPTASRCGPATSPSSTPR